MKHIFQKPKPNKWLIKILVPLNRFINLQGIKLLQWIPIMGKMPVIRGLCDVSVIDFPELDAERLKHLIDTPDHVVFIGPNHPEFYTDWMLDKEISARCAPMVASWATHDIVNGMGKAMQKFWLANGLIAQIPGATKDAKDYSIDHALAGHGVLLHPEGKVGWHSNTIGPLFDGIIDMAREAKRRAPDKKVFIAPIVWKLYFHHNVLVDLHTEMDWIEERLALLPSYHHELDERLPLLLGHILLNIAGQHGVLVKSDVPSVMIEDVIHGLRHLLATECNIDASLPWREALKLLKEEMPHGAKKASQIARHIDALSRWQFGMYHRDKITYEEIAEWLQLVRITMISGHWKDALHRIVPRPIAGRYAVIRMTEPFEIINGFDESRDLNDMIRERMQLCLDGIHQALDQGRKIHWVDNLLHKRLPY